MVTATINFAATTGRLDKRERQGDVEDEEEESEEGKRKVPRLEIRLNRWLRRLSLKSQFHSFVS